LTSITLENVKKVYVDGGDAVNGVSLIIPDGNFTALLGPSGCGNMLLRMIAGLETVSAGAIAIAGRVVNEVEPADRDIAMVFPELRDLPAHERLRQYGLWFAQSRLS
jgi:sn-glycerol 3-phosphate transport system ATP-binding protein